MIDLIRNYGFNAFAAASGGFNWYGFLIGSGMVICIIIAYFMAKKRGYYSDLVFDISICCIPCAIVGARLYYIIFDLIANPDANWTFKRIIGLEGGLSGLAIYGGILAGVASGIIMAKIRKVQVRPALDLAAAGFLIGQSIGRWGNFVNVEAFGCNTTSILGMTGPKVVGYLTQVKNSGAAWAQGIDPTMPVHPTFLYESVWCMTGFLIVALWLMRHRKYDGQVFLFYTGWYGLGRFFIEGLRTDSLMWGPIRVSQALALAAFLVSAALLIGLGWKKKKLGEDFLPLYIHTPDGQAVAAGTFYQKAAGAKTQSEAAAGEQPEPVEQPAADSKREDRAE